MSLHKISILEGLQLRRALYSARRNPRTSRFRMAFHMTSGRAHVCARKNAIGQIWRPPPPPTGGGVATTCWQVFQTVNLRDGPSELVAHISFFVHGQVRRHGSSDATAARTQRKSYATQARRNASQAQRQLGHNASQTQRRSDAAQFQNCLLSPNDFDPNPYQSVFGVCPTLSCMHPESKDCLLVMLQRVSNLGSLLSEGLHLHTQAMVSISRSDGLHVSTHSVHKVKVSMSQPRVSAK